MSLNPYDPCKPGQYNDWARVGRQHGDWGSSKDTTHFLSAKPAPAPAPFSARPSFSSTGMGGGGSNVATGFPCTSIRGTSVPQVEGGRGGCGGGLWGGLCEFIWGVVKLLLFVGAIVVAILIFSDSSTTHKKAKIGAVQSPGAPQIQSVAPSAAEANTAHQQFYSVTGISGYDRLVVHKRAAADSAKIDTLGNGDGHIQIIETVINIFAERTEWAHIAYQSSTGRDVDNGWVAKKFLKSE